MTRRLLVNQWNDQWRIKSMWVWQISVTTRFEMKRIAIRIELDVVNLKNDGTVAESTIYVVYNTSVNANGS